MSEATAEDLSRYFLARIPRVHEEARRELFHTIAGHFEEFGILPECLECTCRCTKQWDARKVGLTSFECSKAGIIWEAK
jgi:hypothetical protein